MSDYEIRRWDIKQVIALTDLMLSFKFTNTTFFHFFLFVLQKSIRALNISHPSSNYPDLLPEMRRYYFEFLFVQVLIKKYEENLKLLSKIPIRRKSRKMSFPKNTAELCEKVLNRNLTIRKY